MSVYNQVHEIDLWLRFEIHSTIMHGKHLSLTSLILVYVGSTLKKLSKSSKFILESYISRWHEQDVVVYSWFPNRLALREPLHSTRPLMHDMTCNAGIQRQTSSQRMHHNFQLFNKISWSLSMRIIECLVVKL